ncbi:MAG: hypothetical protein ABI772_01745 [Bacteroidota bacterium]
MKKQTYLLPVFLLLLNISVNGQNKSAFEHAAKMAFAKEDYASAFGYYITALEYDESDAYVMMMAGECKRRMFEYKTAIAWLNRSIIEDKNHRYPENYFWKSVTHLCMGDLDDAQKMLNNFLYTDSSSRSIGMARYLQHQIEDATVLLNTKDTTDLTDAGTNVNTTFSDFAASALNDSTILFSSLRFETDNKKKKEYASMILKSKMDSVSISKASLLPVEINNSSWHNCNASVSPDGKIMVFSRCNYDKDNKLICSLYESLYINNKWQQPVKLSGDINRTGFTSTQPCITSAGEEGYYLFFASDREGGKGFTDIYYSIRNAKGNYAVTIPVKKINTAGREVTPFYNPLTDLLYFSSDSLYGLGAFDIYKITFHDSLSSPVNLGIPFNSGYNDLYYSANLRHSDNGFISSNRPGSETNSAVCCYDIYRFKPALPAVQEIAVLQPENHVPAKPLEIAVDPVVLGSNLNQLLPLRLYFDNDYPDPKSTQTTTTSVYQNLYSEYSAKIGSYIEGFSTDKSRNEDESRDAIEKFFITELQYNYKQLDKFSSMLADVLKEGYTVNLTVQGFASPLAETRYNLILSARRIASIVNYWKQWQNGQLAEYITSGQFIVTEMAAGEREVQDISDKVNDKANSVYNPKAARERKIEVTNVTVSKP